MALKSNLNMDYSKYDFKDSIDQYVYLSKKGLHRETVEEISRLKDEPEWMKLVEDPKSRAELEAERNLLSVVEGGNQNQAQSKLRLIT